jgi:small GTP-binding protein
MSILRNPEYSFPPEVWANIFSFIDDSDLIFDLEDVCTFFREELKQKIIPGNSMINREIIRKIRNRSVLMPSTHKIDFEAKKPLEFKVGLVGEVDVGKTCLYTAYAQKSATFTNLVYGSGDTPFTTKAKFEGQDVYFKLVDLERFSAQFETPKIDLSTAHGVILCYDVTKVASLTALFRFWLPYIVAKSPGNTIFFLVATKTDLSEHERRISKFTGESIAKMLRMPYWEVSSVKYINVTKLFASVHSAIVHEYYDPDPINPNASNESHHHHHKAKKDCSIM